jgi:hypothetical protein
MDMLAELAIANAAFAVIKQTLMNGKEISDAGKAVGDYFTSEKEIQIQAANGSGDNLLEAYQAKQHLQKQEEDLKFMLNKQGLMGYHNFLQFKANYTREQKELQKVALRKKIASAKAFEENLNIAVKVFGILAVIMASLFGVAIYLR